MSHMKTNEAVLSRSNREKTYRIALVGLFAALAAVGAFIRVPMPLVPFTLQLFFTTMAGLLLGGELGALSVVIYLITGLIGIPVFTSGGGPSYVLQPSFGYLLGFVPGAFVVGKLTQVKRPSIVRVFLACVAGVLAIYAVGVPYLYLVCRFHLGKIIGFKILMTDYFLTFLPADAIKIVLATIIGHRLIPVLRKTPSYKKKTEPEKAADTET